MERNVIVLLCLNEGYYAWHLKGFFVSLYKLKMICFLMPPPKVIKRLPIDAKPFASSVDMSRILLGQKWHVPLYFAITDFAFRNIYSGYLVSSIYYGFFQSICQFGFVMLTYISFKVNILVIRLDTLFSLRHNDVTIFGIIYR